MKDRETVVQEFHDVVNMSAEELEGWLQTPESLHTGMTRPGQDEAVGHQSGRRIVQLLRREDGEYSEDDVQHMSKVVGYVRRHKAQKHNLSGNGDVEHTKWTYSLKNWGHDPMKDADVQEMVQQGA